MTHQGTDNSHVDRHRVRLVSLVAPIILVLVASFAAWRSVAFDQSTWSGAGFGMFATVDGEATRQVRAHVEDNGLDIELPQSLAQAEFEVRVLPTSARLADLGERWRATAGLAETDVLVVEVWSLRFDAASGRLSRSILNQVRLGS